MNNDMYSNNAAARLRTRSLPIVVPLEFRQDGGDYLEATLDHSITYAFEGSGEVSLHLYPTTPRETLEGLQHLIRQAEFLDAFWLQKGTEVPGDERLEFTWQIEFTDANKRWYALSAQYLQDMAQRLSR